MTLKTEMVIMISLQNHDNVPVTFQFLFFSNLSPGSFQKGSENWEMTEEQWNQHQSRIFVKK